MSIIKNKKVSKRVTLQDIANHCGFTKASASMALRGSKRISPATTERILTAALELGYSPELNDSARRLSHLRSNTTVINLVVAAFLPTDFYTRSDSFFSEMFRGMLDVLQEKGYALLINYIRHEADEIPSVFSRGDVDGAIIFSRGSYFKEQLQCLRNNLGFRNKPVVSLLGELPDNCTSMDTDDFLATYEAATYLLQLGHRYIIQCVYKQYSPDDTLSPPLRIAGARKAIADFGLNPDEHLIFFEVESDLTGSKDLPANFNISNQTVPDAKMTRRLLNLLHEHKEFTAILTINDPTAFHLWHILYNAGISVPDDISIIGFDDSYPVMDENGNNQLSSVRIPLHKIGREAAHLVVQLVNDEVSKNEKHIIEHELIIRKSVAPPKNYDLIGNLITLFPTP